VQVFVFLLKGFKSAMNPTAIELGQVFLGLRLDDVLAVARFGVLADRVSFDGHRDHFVFDVVLPEGSTLWQLYKRLHGLLTRHRLVKRKRCLLLVVDETRVIVALREMLSLELSTFLCILLYALIELNLQSIGPLDLIIAPLVVHHTLITRQAFLQG